MKALNKGHIEAAIFSTEILCPLLNGKNISNTTKSMTGGTLIILFKVVVFSEWPLREISLHQWNAIKTVNAFICQCSSSQYPPVQHNWYFNSFLTPFSPILSMLIPILVLYFPNLLPGTKGSIFICNTSWAILIYNFKQTFEMLLWMSMAFLCIPSWC